MSKHKDDTTITVKAILGFFVFNRLMYTLKYRLKLYFINLKTNFIPKTFIYDCLQLGQNYKLVDENKIFSILAFRDQKYEGYLCCQGLPQQPGDDPPKSSFLSI